MLLAVRVGHLAHSEAYHNAKKEERKKKIKEMKDSKRKGGEGEETEPSAKRQRGGKKEEKADEKKEVEYTKGCIVKFVGVGDGLSRDDIKVDICCRVSVATCN